MNFNEYQQLASRTSKRNDKNIMLVNYAMGLCGEAGEVTDYLKKVIFHGHEMDKENVKKELGDVLWYVSQLAKVIGADLEDIAVQNIEKLKQRYPEGFSEEASVNRNES